MFNYYIKIPPKKKERNNHRHLNQTRYNNHTRSITIITKREQRFPPRSLFSVTIISEKKKQKEQKSQPQEFTTRTRKKDNRKKGSKRRRIKIRENTPETFPPSPFPPPTFLPPHCVVNTGFGHSPRWFIFRNRIVHLGREGVAHSLGAAGGGGGGDIFRKAEAAAQRVHSLFTLSGSVCPTQPRPRNPPPPLDQPPFLLLVSPPPRPNDRFLSANGARSCSVPFQRTLDIFHRPNRGGRRRGRLELDEVSWNFCVGKFRFEDMEGGGRNRGLGFGDFVVRICR